MINVNENIRFLRKKKGWTQEKFSHKIGIKRSLVGAYEEDTMGTVFQGKIRSQVK